jgi:hypothetical protein
MNLINKYISRIVIWIVVISVSITSIHFITKGFNSDYPEPDLFIGFIWLIIISGIICLNLMILVYFERRFLYKQKLNKKKHGKV